MTDAPQQIAAMHWLLAELGDVRATLDLPDGHQWGGRGRWEEMRGELEREIVRRVPQLLDALPDVPDLTAMNGDQT